MDSQINAAARALSAGDPLGALDRVALREDPPALALRGIAMAQLGELPRARELLRAAARRLKGKEPLAWARCVVAEAEVALALRELAAADRQVDDALLILERHADLGNVAHARLVRMRRLLLLGRCDDAEQESLRLNLQDAAPMHRALAALVAAEVAIRRVDARTASEALQHAMQAAEQTPIRALAAEVERARLQLDQPAARRGDGQRLTLWQVQAVFESDALVVDGCRRASVLGDDRRGLSRRPVLFGLLLVLAKAWPDAVARERLVNEVFEADTRNEAWRVRLRVEIGRLRKLVAGQASVEATAKGFVLRPERGIEVVVLLPPVDGEHAAIAALLGDGAPWSTSALALALGVSQRTVQRALTSLQDDGVVRSLGRARAQRWLASPQLGTTTALLLPLVPPAR